MHGMRPARPEPALRAEDYACRSDRHVLQHYPSLSHHGAVIQLDEADVQLQANGGGEIWARTGLDVLLCVWVRMRPCTLEGAAAGTSRHKSAQT